MEGRSRCFRITGSPCYACGNPVPWHATIVGHGTTKSSEGTEVAARLPRFAVHVTRAGAWETIREQTLLTTEDVVAGGATADGPIDVKAFISTHRKQPVVVTPRYGGTVVVNHNGPIRTRVLEQCLANAPDVDGRPPTAASFYESLNRHVFFWPSHTLGAAGRFAATFEKEVSATGRKLLRPPELDRLWVDLPRLADAVGDRIGLSKYNSGSTPQYVKQVERYGIARGPRMWDRVENWSLPPGKVKEVAVEHSIAPEQLLPAVVLVERGRRDSGFDHVLTSRAIANRFCRMVRQGRNSSCVFPLPA